MNSSACVVFLFFVLGPFPLFFFFFFFGTKYLFG